MRKKKLVLTELEIQFVRDVLGSPELVRTSELDYAMDTHDFSNLPPSTRMDLCEALGTEFMISGLQPDSEPNARGLAIEDLIDKLNPALE